MVARGRKTQSQHQKSFRQQFRPLASYKECTADAQPYSTRERHSASQELTYKLPGIKHLSGEVIGHRKKGMRKRGTICKEAGPCD